ncbi:MAG: helix-turn-helix transcriptional regulator [Alphaproteobacteria bacterium]
MITAPQLRAARGILDWTRADLAKAANVSPETIKNIEHGTFRPQEATAEAIIRAFGSHDVTFTENEGVQKKKDLVKTFTGGSGYKDFLDHIYLSVQRNRDDRLATRQFNYSDEIIKTFADDFSGPHLERMQSIPGLDAKCLVPEGDYNFPASHCEYRWLKKVHAGAIPFYLYGNNVSMVSDRSDKEIVFISIHSELLASLFYSRFDMYWQEAAIPPKRV